MRLPSCCLQQATKKPPNVMLSGKIDWVRQTDQSSFCPGLIQMRRTGPPMRTRRSR
jgi:hypothetical protein